MSTTAAVTKNLSRLARVPVDDTLMTIMLLNDEPIIAIASTFNSDEGEGSGHRRFCHIIRVDDAWAEA